MLCVVYIVYAECILLSILPMLNVVKLSMLTAVYSCLLSMLNVVKLSMLSAVYSCLLSMLNVVKLSMLSVVYIVYAMCSLCLVLSMQNNVFLLLCSMSLSWTSLSRVSWHLSLALRNQNKPLGYKNFIFCSSHFKSSKLESFLLQNHYSLALNLWILFGAYPPSHAL